MSWSLRKLLFCWITGTKFRFFFNNFYLCLILKGNGSSLTSSHDNKNFILTRRWKNSRDTLDSREIQCDSHFRSWPNVTLFKRPISRFIKKRALNFHFFWSWCVHDDPTTRNQPSDNHLSFHCPIFESGIQGRYRTRCRSQTRTNKLSKIRLKLL